MGLSGLASLSRRLPGYSALEKVRGIIALFEQGKLSTHDDATQITKPVIDTPISARQEACLMHDAGEFFFAACG